jgi:hypothetical protein
MEHKHKKVAVALVREWIDLIKDDRSAYQTSMLESDEYAECCGPRPNPMTATDIEWDAYDKRREQEATAIDSAVSAVVKALRSKLAEILEQE